MGGSNYCAFWKAVLEKTALAPRAPDALKTTASLTRRAAGISGHGHGHRFATLFVFAAGMADKPLAIRVCPAWMPDPSLQGGIHGVPNGRRLVCLRIRAISYPLNGDPDETMTMATVTKLKEPRCPCSLAC
jgi:hypothetical protein